MVPKMADLPAARLRLFKPVFHSTGMDCFGPFQVKVGRRLEKRWGIIFKCLTTHAVHVDLLTNTDADSFFNGPEEVHCPPRDPSRVVLRSRD